MSGHAIVHIEISANNQEETGKFYSELFGWKTEAIPQMDYVTFGADSGPGGGFPKVDGKMTQAGQVIIYISTDDIDASLAKAESLGGKTVVPKTEIPNMGFFGIFTDPTGNHIGLYSGQ